MTFVKVFPDQTSTSDATFFPQGIRLSNGFIDREALEGKSHVSIYVNEADKQIGFRFFSSKRPQSLKLTPSGENTVGKTISCSFLKRYDWIQRIMENPDIKSRRFLIDKKRRITSHEGDNLDFIINLNPKITDEIPF